MDNIKKVSSAPIGQGTLGGYFSADVFIAAVKKAGKNLTPESFAKVIEKFTYQIDGVIGPTKYPQSSGRRARRAARSRRATGRRTRSRCRTRATATSTTRRLKPVKY